MEWDIAELMVGQKTAAHQFERKNNGTSIFSVFLIQCKWIVFIVIEYTAVGLIFSHLELCCIVIEYNGLDPHYDY